MAAGGRRTVAVDVDLNAELNGFGAARKATAAHHQIMKHYASPLLLGPPPSDLLLEWVTHIYTEDEADLVAHLPPLRPRTAHRVAQLSGRSYADAWGVLERLASTKRVILAAGKPRRYTILPVLPGTFEMTLLTTDLSSRNSWHKKSAEIFERLWSSGFFADYVRISPAPLRVLPASGAVDTMYQAWPSDLLEQVLEPYDLFAVGQCQCRMAMAFVGKSCGKPTDNCVAFGPIGRFFVDRDMMRPVGRAEVIGIKHEAEENGCVTWMVNSIGGQYGNISCSCCGCCCHALRTLNDFNAPGAISSPHFLPRKVADRCRQCKTCLKTCPTGAWSASGSELSHSIVRCIGCGLCVVACRHKALMLVTAEAAKPPEEGWLRLLLKMAPSYLSTSLRVFSKRLFGRLTGSMGFLSQ